MRLGGAEERRAGKGLKVWALRGLVAAGFIALSYYYSWWFVDGRLASPGLAVWFALALLYSGVQLAGNWVIYLAARRPAAALPPPPGLTVDVFITACGEDYALVERSLAAAVRMRGEHRTWLLDDGGNPLLAELAGRLGAGYLARGDRANAKAGNLNAALPRTDGDVVAIFDIDHVPAPDFLERSLGHFSDPRVGFVQVMLTFANSQESWVAQAAMETSLEFYNPTSLGADGIGGTTMMGSNALIRRKALESIGGYRPGLAEDLATSIALHAAGWRSAYVAEPLAPGLAPPSFTAWFVQQLKWARGVFELLLTGYPAVFWKLSGGQRLSYAVRMTKYWIGPAVGLHLFATVAVMVFSPAAFRDAFHDYLVRIGPLAICDALIRFAALSSWRHPATPRTSFSRAVVLVYATWPIYLMAWLMALLRLPLGFRPTPKSRSGNLNPAWLLPQALALGLLAAGALYTTFGRGHPPSVLLVFAFLQGALQLLLFKQWLATEIEFSEKLSRSFQALREITRPVGINRRAIRGQLRATLGDLQSALHGLPVDRLEQAAGLLHQARLSGRRVFVLEGERPWLAARFAADLAQAPPGNPWPAFQVLRVADGPALDGPGGGGRLLLEEYARSVGPGDVAVALAPGRPARQLGCALERARAMQAKTILLSGPASGAGPAGGAGISADAHLQVAGETAAQVEDRLALAARVIVQALHHAAAGRAAPPGQAPSPAGAPALPALFDLAGPGAGPLPGGGAELDRAALLGRALRACLESVGATSGSLLLFDQAGRAEQAALLYGGEVSFQSGALLADTLAQGLAGWVAANRQPALVASTAADPRWLRRPWDEINGPRSAVSVPLFAGERLAGVLTALHVQPDRFTPPDAALLAAMAASLAAFGRPDPARRDD
jgi:cellulose synthase (UDP-forming)